MIIQAVNAGQQIEADHFGLAVDGLGQAQALGNQINVRSFPNVIGLFALRVERSGTLAVRIGLRFRAFLVGEAAAVEVAVRNLRGQIDRCRGILNADSVCKRFCRDNSLAERFLRVARVAESAIRVLLDMNDLVVREIDRRNRERSDRLVVNIDAGVSRVVRREAKAPALFVDGLDGDLKNDLLAAGLAVVRADPVRGIIKARYCDGLTVKDILILTLVVVIAPRRRVAVSVDGGAGLGVDLNRLGIYPVRVQIKILRNGVLEDGRFRQRDACAADLLTDLLEDACQVSTGCRRAVVLGGNRCSSARQARRVRIVGGNIVHVSGRVSFRRGAEAADREDRGSAVFEGLGCGDRAVSNRSFKGAAACRLTVGEHNGDLFAAAVRVRQNGLRVLHTEVCPCCAACQQGIDCSFQSASVVVYICQVLNDLRIVRPATICVARIISLIADCVFLIACKLNDGNAIRMSRVGSCICSVNKALYCNLQGIQLCDINITTAIR